MRKTGVALAAFALAVTLGACGDKAGSGNNTGGGAENGGGVVAAANVADLAKSIGDKTAETNTAHFSLTADAAGQKVSGEGDIKFSGEAAAMTMDMTTPDGNVSMVLLDKVFYIKTGEEIAPGKTWIKIDTNDDNPLAKALAGTTQEMSKNADPRAALAEFEKSGEITSSKEETLDGQKTMHYTITVDVQKLADNQADPAMKSALTQAIQGGLKNFPVDMWVNEDELPVRFAMDMPMGDVTGSGQNVSMKMQMDYSKWGEPVEVAAPPAEQVGELPAGN